MPLFTVRYGRQRSWLRSEGISTYEPAPDRVDRPVAGRDAAKARLERAHRHLVAPVRAFLVLPLPSGQPELPADIARRPARRGRQPGPRSRPAPTGCWRRRRPEPPRAPGRRRRSAPPPCRGESGRAPGPRLRRAPARRCGPRSRRRRRSPPGARADSRSRARSGPARSINSSSLWAAMISETTGVPVPAAACVARRRRSADEHGQRERIGDMRVDDSGNARPECDRHRGHRRPSKSCP